MKLDQNTDANPSSQSAPRLTQKQENFCLEYLTNQGNATSAYKHAYNCSKMKSETINREATEIMKLPNITTRIAELRAPVVAEAVQKYSTTLDKALAELDDARIKALAAPTPQVSAAVAAIMGKAKLLGLIPTPDRVAVSANVTIASLIREIEVGDSVDLLGDSDK